MCLKILICRVCLLLSYYLSPPNPERIAFQVPWVLYASGFETSMLSFVKWGWNSTNHIPSLSAGWQRFCQQGSLEGDVKARGGSRTLASNASSPWQGQQQLGVACRFFSTLPEPVLPEAWVSVPWDLSESMGAATCRHYLTVPSGCLCFFFSALPFVSPIYKLNSLCRTTYYGFSFPRA